MKGWTATKAADYHVLPVRDLVEHEEFRQCWCHPRLEHGHGATVVIHNSADGREHFEPGTAPVRAH